MAVAVILPSGEKAAIAVQWMSKEADVPPPKDWPEMVLEEIGYQKRQRMPWR